MCWADRATLILAFLWAIFLVAILGAPASNPYAWVTPEWWVGILLLILIPAGVVWVVLRLVLGTHGRAY